MNIEFYGYLIREIITNQFFKLDIFLIVFLIVIVLLRKNYEKWNKGWLSVLIEEKIKQSKTLEKGSNKKASYSIEEITKLFSLSIVEFYAFFKNNLNQKIAKDIKKIYLPSWVSLIGIITLCLILFALIHTDIPYKSFAHLDKWIPFLKRAIPGENKSDIISIITGLVSIVFALVIFVAESIRDSKNPDQKRVLLKISFLWPLIVFTVLALINFVIFKINSLSIIFPLLIGGLSIYSFWKIITYLVNPHIQEENNKQFLKQRIKDNINESIKERIGNSILLEKVGYDKDIKFEYTFSKNWISGNISDYIFINSNREGRIIDVNLNELQKLTNYLKIEAEKLKFKIYPTEDVTASPGEGPTIQKKSQEKFKTIYLLKRYGEYIPPNSIFNNDENVIFALPKEYSSNKHIAGYIEGVIPHIFKFSNDRPSSEIFRKEMKGIKDRIINSINSASIGAVEELKKSYLDLAETFLETIYQYGVYSSEQAKKERGNFFEGWNEIRWLYQDIREIMQIAIGSDNQDIISDVMFLPISIAIRSFRVRDHYLFQEFLPLNSYAYYLALNKSKGQIRSFIIDRSWRYLKEMSDLYIEPKIKDRYQVSSKEEIIDYKEFALYVLKTFQGLIKASFNKKDFKSFKIFLNEFKKLYKHLEKDREYPDSNHLRVTLDRITDPEQKKNTQAQLDIVVAKEEATKSISFAKKQIFFVLASKILDHYKKDQKNTQLKDFFDFVNTNINFSIEEMSKVFDLSRNFESEDYWDWDDGEIPADGEVHSIDIHSKLDYFYCIKMLSLLKGKTPEQIKKLHIMPSRNLAFLAEKRADNSTLISKLNEIKSKPQDWLFVIDQGSIDRVDECIELLQRIKEEQEKDEAEYLKTAKIDPDKLIEFKDKIITSFNKSAKIRPLVKIYNIYSDKTEEMDKEIPLYGYNQVDEKAAFLKDWHVHFLGWGEQYGAGMASSEDQIFFEGILKELDQKIETDSNKLIEIISQSIDKYKLEDPVIIQSLEYPIEYDSIRGSEHFVDRWSNECPKTKISHLDGFLGVLKYDNKIIPVFDIFVRDKKNINKVVIADISKLGVWEQYSPISKLEDKEYVNEKIFSIKVSDLNVDDDMRKKIISEKSKWLEKHSDKDGYLRQKVVSKIYEKFRFLVKDKSKGIAITVSAAK